MKEVKDNCTENIIKKAAKKLFFVDGNIHATTQEIADAAGVNRTLLNYYFRSRDELFRQVYVEAREEIGKKLDAAFMIDLPFREKVAHFIEVFTEQITMEPFAEVFMVAEINDPGKSTIHPKRDRTSVNHFLKEIEREMEKGTIRKMEPFQFIVNLFALMSHPVIMRPVYYDIFHFNDQQFQELYSQRKKMILEMMFCTESAK